MYYCVLVWDSSRVKIPVMLGFLHLFVYRKLLEEMKKRGKSYG
jgi:hypothetical protein